MIEQTIMLHITATLSELRKQMTEQEQSQLADVVLDFIDQMKADQATGLTLSHISASLHQVADEFLAEAKGKSVTSQDIRCREGCAHCCHLAVAITVGEAEELVAVASAQGLAIDHAKLARQVGYTDETWLRLAPEDRRCVFLGTDNRCQVYEHRPFSCRKYFSTANPELCNIDKYPKLSIPIWFDVRTEALTTAAMTHFGSGFLPDMILNVLQPKKETT